MIAKFDRLGVDSACISFWDGPHPGRLGSLMASNAEPSGGWWFYKGYGDMAGNMVSTTPPVAVREIWPGRRCRLVSVAN
ncbi:MAG TPA: hypothetical protein VHM25_24855 [Polyangiaceae bacterium]|nr:hypothetical protein [Polyangiaceae bacterium]